MDLTEADRELVRAAVRRKERSLQEPEDVLAQEVAAEADRIFGDRADGPVRGAIRYLAARLHRAGSAEGPAYLKHALRVALLALRWDPAPEPETATLAVLHNIHEVTGMDEPGLRSAGFPDLVVSGVAALTIDRGRSEDDSYLRGFYAAIERAGHHAVLVRCVDKLDNILGYDASGRDVARARYVDLTERFVLPMAVRISAPMGRVLAAAIAEARAAR